MTEWAQQLCSFADIASGRGTGAASSGFDPLWNATAGVAQSYEPDRSSEAAIEARLQEASRGAYAKGIADGMAQKEQELAEQAADARSQCELAIAESERRFLETEGAAIAARIEEGLARIEREAESAVLEILRAFVGRHMQLGVVNDAVETLKHAVAVSGVTTVKLAGREELVMAAKAALDGTGIQIEAGRDAEDELVFQLDGAAIKSRLRSWMGSLEAAIE